MNRKRPAQRQTSSRSIVKSKTRSFAPPRAARSVSSKKSVSRSIFSKRKKPSISSKKSSRTNTDGSWWQTLLLWVILLGGGGWLAWYILVWGIVPKLLFQQESNTIAILPTVAGGDVLVAQLEPELKKSKVYQLNGEEPVKLPGQYGEYRLSAIYQLLLIDSKDERYFRGTLNRVFGVFFDREVVIPGSLATDSQYLSSQIKSAFWNELVTNKKLSTDLLKTWYVLQYNNTLVKPDSVVSLVDEIRNHNGGTFAARDECRVAILNSTTTSGLAGGLSDIVEKNGGIVIRLGQYSNVLETSQLLYDPSLPECQEAIHQIETLSPVPFEVIADPSVQGEFRAPIVAIIGKNFE